MGTMARRSEVPHIPEHKSVLFRATSCAHAVNGDGEYASDSSEMLTSTQVILYRSSIVSMKEIDAWSATISFPLVYLNGKPIRSCRCCICSSNSGMREYSENLSRLPHVS